MSLRDHQSIPQTHTDQGDDSVNWIFEASQFVVAYGVSGLVVMVVIITINMESRILNQSMKAREACVVLMVGGMSIDDGDSQFQFMVNIL